MDTTFGCGSASVTERREITAQGGCVRARARRPVWLAGAALVGSETSGAGIGDGLYGLRLRRCDGAAGAHGPGLSPVPLPRVRQAVQ